MYSKHYSRRFADRKRELVVSIAWLTHYLDACQRRLRCLYWSHQRWPDANREGWVRPGRKRTGYVYAWRQPGWIPIRVALSGTSLDFYSRDGSRLFSTGAMEPRKEPRYEPGRIIVSLTTIPERIRFVPRLIAQILAGDSRPDFIWLWVGETSYDLIRNEATPAAIALRELERHTCLEIRLCRDIGPITKVFYSIGEAGERDIVITVDDDLWLGRRWLSSLMHWHRKYPDCALSFRGELYEPEGRYFEYMIGHSLFPWPVAVDAIEGVGTCLYRRRFFDETFVGPSEQPRVAADDRLISRHLEQNDVPRLVLPQPTHHPLETHVLDLRDLFPAGLFEKQNIYRDAPPEFTQRVDVQKWLERRLGRPGRPGPTTVEDPHSE